MEQQTEFNSQEQQILSPFFTNLDKPIFCLRNLPEVVKGALFSRYSRSPNSLRRILLEEFINAPEMSFKEIVGEQSGDEMVAVRKAEEFYERVLVGYGDDSVAELGGAHIACENVSIIASKVLEDSRIGLSPLEKSTRYVYFDEKVNGRYRYLLEPKISGSAFEQAYTRACEQYFDTYAKLIPRLKSYVIEKFPQQEGITDRAYNSTIRAKVCDILRGLLPASTLTNVGLYGNGRAFEYLISKMYSSELGEIRAIAGSMHQELGKVIPSFVKRANDKYGLQQQQYWRECASESLSLSKELLGGGHAIPNAQFEPVVLVETEPEEAALEKICAAIMLPHSSLPLAVLYQRAKAMSAEQKKALVKAYVGVRGNRRNRPGRAFEQVHYTFDLVGNYGMFRDLHRHRMLTQQRQLFGVSLGFDVPPELVDAGMEGEFKECMETAREAFSQISPSMPLEAQYVVPLAYRIRWGFTLTLREAFHLIELRSMPQGHRDYRKMVQQMYYEIRKVHPFFAELMNFTDLNEYPFLERLESEKKIDKKSEELAQKYGKPASQ